MEIRRAELSDMEGIKKLLSQVELVHHEGRPDLFKNGGRKYNDAELKELIADDMRPIFVGVEDGRVLGYAFCIMEDFSGDNVRTPIKSLYIDDLCVDETIRGRGIGRAIYAFVEDYARREGCYNITLNAWVCNPKAVSFYEGLGLKPYKF